MGKKEYVTYGSCQVGVPGAKADIAGCSFMLAPMTEHFEEVIMPAVLKTDTSRVWTTTGKLGTIYRGKAIDVLDTVKACFAFAWQPDVHMTCEMTLTKGCPGDSDNDYVIAEGDEPANEKNLQDIHFPVDCKFALYPLGDLDYIAKIADVANEAIDRGLYQETMHYATVLKGDVHELFAYFGWLLDHCGECMSHFVIQITLSVNSPSPDMPIV